MAIQVNGKELNKNYFNIFSKNLISWHKKNGRHDLPWQININPYKIWISEIMLQQTQVQTVIPFYNKFIEKYKNIEDLSNAKLDDILELWSGLGYYRRAANIYKSSQILKNQYSCIFPKKYNDILSLPGVGRSTAGAILSLAFNEKYPILDGNVKRIIKRYFALRGLNNSENNLWKISELLLPSRKNNIYSQSIMDLGFLVCIKKKPLCNICPVKLCCRSNKLKLTDLIPEKIHKKNKKNIIKLFFLVIQNNKNKNLVLMKKNSQKSIWSNLWNFPNFSKKKEYTEFINENNFSKKVFLYCKIKSKLTHLTYDIDVLKVHSKKEINIDHYYWKNIYDKIGSPRPVIIIIKKLLEEINNANNNV